MIVCGFGALPAWQRLSADALKWRCAIFENDDIIHRYTRADALADGTLLDLTPMAAQVGIRYPVACTSAVWQRCVEIPPGVEAQDEAGRQWDVVWMLHCAIRRSDGGPLVEFSVHVRNDNQERTPPLVRLKALCGPGDDGSPVITILLPDED